MKLSGTGAQYFSLKPPPTPDPFLFTETVASSNPHVAATLKVAAHKTRRKDSSWLGVCMISCAIACGRMLEGHNSHRNAKTKLTGKLRAL